MSSRAEVDDKRLQSQEQRS